MRLTPVRTIDVVEQPVHYMRGVYLLAERGIYHD